MRGTFRWERDTENYRRYVSETRDPRTGRYQVIYFPKSLNVDLPKVIPDIISSDSENGLQCCHRDNDFDGNCAIHSAPGVLREHSRAPDHIHQFDAYRYASEHLYGRAFDLALRHFEHHGTETGRFPHPIQYASWGRHNELEARVTKIEQRQGILFQALGKIIKIIRYWNLDERKGRKKWPIKPGEYDAEITSTNLRNGRWLDVEMEIHRK